MNPRFLDIHELSALLGVSPQTIRCNRRDHPLYSRAEKLGGVTSPLKWRREDVAKFLGVDVGALETATPQQSAREADLLMREGEVARRERAVADAIHNMNGILRQLQGGL